MARRSNFDLESREIIQRQGSLHNNLWYCCVMRAHVSVYICNGVKIITPASDKRLWSTFVFCLFVLFFQRRKWLYERVQLSVWRWWWLCVCVCVCVCGCVGGWVGGWVRACVLACVRARASFYSTFWITILFQNASGHPCSILFKPKTRIRCLVKCLYFYIMTEAKWYTPTHSVVFNQTSYNDTWILMSM